MSDFPLDQALSPQEHEADPLVEAHAEHLQSSAIRLEVARHLGARSIRDVDDLPQEFLGYGAQVLPALLLPWHGPDGIIPQLRPDKPIRRSDGKTGKYVWPKGVSPILSHVRTGSGTIAFVEGWKQAAAFASWCPEDTDVYAFLGAWGIQALDLSLVEGRDIVFIFDADVTTNHQVHSAANVAAEQAKLQGANSVRFAKIPAAKSSTDGIDDYLARLPEEKRAGVVARLLEGAVKTLGRAPAKPPRKKGQPSPEQDVEGDGGTGHEWFNEDGLRVRDFAFHNLEKSPALLTKEGSIVVYRDGVYQTQNNPWRALITNGLGNLYTTSHEKNVTAQAEGILQQQDRYLPETVEKPIIACNNGVLVQLWDEQAVEWTPDHLSTVKLPVDWDPEAKAPLYEQWLTALVGDQIDDLEESLSLMLDPTTTPSKAVVLYGESRSGKSTLTRFMQAIAGTFNTSAVSLHQLSNDQFAVANLYNKILNVSADLSSLHVEDISQFKKVTGADIIQANRKYGQQFPFTNRALFLFSANRLPTVGESSRAYAARIKPFKFDNSFEGDEKPHFEEYILKHELPGILVRLVKAFRRFYERGRRYQEGSAQIKREFEQRSDRVARWMNEQCVISPSSGKTRMPEDKASTVSVLYRSFQEWIKDEGGVNMSRSTFSDRLMSITGVENIRMLNGSRGVNVSVNPSRAPANSEPSTAVASVTPKASSSDLDRAFEELTRLRDQGWRTSPGPSPVPVESPVPVQEKLPEPDWEQLEFEFPTEDPAPFPVSVTESSTESLPEAEQEDESVNPDHREQPDIRELPAGYVALDLETAGNKIFKEGYVGPFVRIAGYLIGGEDQIRVTTDIDEVMRVIAEATVVIGHNVATFDLLALCAHHGLDLNQFIIGEEKRLLDTKYLGILRDPPLSRQKKGWVEKYYSLHEQAQRLGWEGKANDLAALAKKYGGYDRIPTDDPDYIEYLIRDVVLTAQLGIVFERELREKSQVDILDELF